MIWYSWDQTAYGYPGPFIRLFDKPLEGYGNYVFDISSLLFNCMFLFAALFAVVAVASFLVKRAD